MDINNELFKAVQEENIVMLRALLEGGADPNHYVQHDDGSDGSLLHYTRSKDIAEELLKHGAIVDSRDWYGSTPLFSAVQKGLLDVVRVLLNGGASLNAMDGLGEHLLSRAIRYCEGNLEILRTLLICGANVNSHFSNHFPPLHIAVLANRVDIIDTLLLFGASLNQRDVVGLTALHLALRNSGVKLPTIKKLLDAGADVNSEYSHHCYPIDLAVTYRDVVVVRELLKYGAKINAESDSPNSTLYKAVNHCSSVDVALVQELLNHGAKAGSYMAFAKSPAEYAVKQHLNSLKIPPYVKLLIKYSTVDFIEVYENYSYSQMKFYLERLVDFAIECIWEVAKMRNVKIFGRISFFDILKYSIDQKKYYEDSVIDIKSHVFDILCNYEFPIYEEIIFSMLGRDYIMEKIHSQEIFTFSNSNKVVLVSDTIHPILSYLSDFDILHFALAYGKLNSKK